MDSAVIRISRNFSEVCELRDVLVASPLKVVKDRALKAGSLPFDEDGLEDFIEDVNALLALVEGVESWMNKILEVRRRSPCLIVTALGFSTAVASCVRMGSVNAHALILLPTIYLPLCLSSQR